MYPIHSLASSKKVLPAISAMFFSVRTQRRNSYLFQSWSSSRQRVTLGSVCDWELCVPSGFTFVSHRICRTCGLPITKRGFVTS